MTSEPPAWMHEWPWSAPRPTGRWTVTDGTRYGLLDPEHGRVTPVDPIDDVRLPGIAAAIEHGEQLVAYRHGRRAVTRQKSSFTKIVRPSRSVSVADNHRLLTNASGFRTPTLIDSFDDGRVQIEAVGGPSLHDRLRVGARLPIDEVASAVAAFNDTAVPADTLAPATPDEPARWIDIVSRMNPSLRHELQHAADTLPLLDTGGSSLVHTDLHDKNVLLSERGVNIIDLDGLALGTPEVDVVNLAVHLELRALQAGLAPAEGRRQFEQFVTAYDIICPLDPSTVSAIERHTWFRLACLYLCRASGVPLAGALLQRATAPA
jgi:hypothetical protein